MRQKILPLLATIMLLVACSSTSTPDLKVIAILHCEDDLDKCEVRDDKECEGRGRFIDLSGHDDVVVYDNMGKRMKGEELSNGQFDDVHNTCTFSATVNIKSTSQYQIQIGDLPGTRIMKTDLEDQNWTVVLEFNN